MTDEQNPQPFAEREKREEMRRQIRALKRRFIELVEKSGANADTPLHAIFPAWPLPEEVPDRFDWDAIERELRDVVVARMDPYGLIDLQKRLVCVSFGMDTALLKHEVTIQQADRIADIVDRLLEKLGRQAERLKAAS